jgi:predicted MFS family arabinose efflux permease
LFAQFGSWRWAFGALAVLTVAMAILVPFALPGRRPGAEPPPPSRIPVWSLLLLGMAALAISVAGIPRNTALTAALLAAGVALVLAFLVVDRRTSASVLPPTAFRPGPLKWIYLTLGLLMAATMVDMYVPFFGQRLAHLTPIAAGFLGAGLAIGWTVGEISSASLRSSRVISWTVAVAPLVMATGLTIAALTQFEEASIALVGVWAVALLITGTGVGIAWPHLSAWAMTCVDDPAEGAAAAAAINTVQLICGAFGAGLAGVVVNMTDTGDATPARWAFVFFALLAAAGAIASFRARVAAGAGS